MLHREGMCFKIILGMTLAKHLKITELVVSELKLVVNK